MWQSSCLLKQFTAGFKHGLEQQKPYGSRKIFENDLSCKIFETIHFYEARARACHRRKLNENLVCNLLFQSDNLSSHCGQNKKMFTVNFGQIKVDISPSCFKSDECEAKDQITRCVCAILTVCGRIVLRINWERFNWLLNGMPQIRQKSGVILCNLSVVYDQSKAITATFATAWFLFVCGLGHYAKTYEVVDGSHNVCALNFFILDTDRQDVFNNNVYAFTKSFFLDSASISQGFSAINSVTTAFLYQKEKKSSLDGH